VGVQVPPSVLIIREKRGEPLSSLLAIQCRECKETRYKQDFAPSVGEQRFATCDCGNIKIGTKAMEGSFIPWYVTVHYSDSAPHIFQTDKRRENKRRKKVVVGKENS
jgi:hypothetical protein